jgi:uncharacterized protein YegJ (DUF2314 family)
MKSRLLALVCVTFALNGCDSKERGGETVRREGKPNYLRVPFIVKKPFKDGEKVEHIWLSDVSFDGTNFRGRVDNEPLDVKNVTLGATATAAKGEISDWSYVDDGKLVGGYTIRVLYARMTRDEKKDFEAHGGFKIK